MKNVERLGTLREVIYAFTSRRLIFTIINRFTKTMVFVFFHLYLPSSCNK